MTQKHWVCNGCGTDAWAEEPPNFGWTDGHRCRFRLSEEEI